MTSWFLAPECVHFNWNIQMKMVSVEASFDSNAEIGG